MMRIMRLFAAVILAAFPCAALAQQVPLQAGPWQAGHTPMYTVDGTTQPIIQDSGTAAGGTTGTTLSELAVTTRATGTPPFANIGNGPNYSNLCDYDGPTDSAGGYHYLCFSPNSGGAGLISYGSVGSAAQQGLAFMVNGAAFDIPATGFGDVVGPSSATDGDIAVFDGTSGKLLKDGGTPPSYSAGTGLALSDHTFSVDNSVVATYASGVLTSAVTQSSITTLGTVTNGTWQGDPIADSYISSAATWNAKLSNITGLITEGTDIVIGGSGTADDPYQISSTGGGGGSGGTVTSVGVSVPSFMSVSGSPVTASGTIALGLSGTALPVANGGTGGTSASAARTALSAAGSGANSDITALSGLTTPLSTAQGGTGSATISGARTNLIAAKSGDNSDITSLSGLTTPLSVAQGGTGANNATTARSMLSAAGSGSNSDITAMSALTSITSSNLAISGNVAMNAALSVSVASPSGATVTLGNSASYFQCLGYSGAAVSLTATDTGKTFLIKDCKGTAGTSNDVITPSSGNIDGASSFSLSQNYQAIAVTFDGTNWWIN